VHLVTGNEPVPHGDVRRALETSIAQAKHLSKLDDAAVAAARALADKIDAWDVIVQFALADIAGVKGARPAVPQNDNVSLSAFLRYCEALGLTPMSRKALEAKTGGGGKLKQMREAQGGSAAG